MSALARSLSAFSTRRPFAERLPRRRRKTAWVMAVSGPLLITLGSRLVGLSVVPPATILFATLLVAVVVALIGGIGPALVAIVVGLFAQELVFTFPYGSLNNRDPAQISVLVVFVVIGAGIGIVVDELNRLSTEQAALRRIATLVAQGIPPAELFAAVAEEVARLVDADAALVARLEPDGVATIVAAGGERADEHAVGEGWQVEPPMAIAGVVLTGQPARTDDYDNAPADVAERIRKTGIRSSVATPIVVQGLLWGVIVASSRREALPADSEQRMLDFTELVATAIANAESRAELAASRARIVAASDEARRRVERDLHDGTQQRLVTLALALRSAQSGVPPHLEDVHTELSLVARGFTAVLEELREISRGIHPAILSEGGLAPALKTLARRSPIPVVLDARCDGRLPDGIERAAYYVVSEMLTNAAKHAQASTVHVDLARADGVLHVAVRDDGIGGADPARGSGLIGLRDRVEALGGTIAVRSPKGGGTAVEVALPLERASG
jgi:signal transduction histidine kinase